MAAQYDFIGYEVEGGRLYAVFSDGTRIDRGPAPVDEGDLPPTLVADVAAAKATAAQALALAGHADVEVPDDGTPGFLLVKGAGDAGMWVDPATVVADVASELDALKGGLGPATVAAPYEYTAPRAYSVSEADVYVAVTVDGTAVGVLVFGGYTIVQAIERLNVLSVTPVFFQDGPKVVVRGGIPVSFPDLSPEASALLGLDPGVSLAPGEAELPISAERVALQDRPLTESLDALAATDVALRDRVANAEAATAGLADRLSTDEAILAGQSLALASLAAARDAHQAAIAANASAVATANAAIAALQAAGAGNGTAIAALQAAVAALQAKVDFQSGTLTAVQTSIAALQAADTAAAALVAAQGIDVATLKGARVTNEAAISAAQTAISALQANRTTDAAAIAANTAAIAALQGLRATDASAIAANGIAIGGIQSAQVADEANIAANGAAIVALQNRATTDEANIASTALAVTALQTRATNEEAAIAANAARLLALETGAPAVYGPVRPIVPAADNAVPVAAYTVLRRSQGRGYTFSLANPSVANALSISATGVLSTVQAGWDALAGGGTVTVTVRATNDGANPATFDLAVVVEKVAAASAGAGKPGRVVLSATRYTGSATWVKADFIAANPKATHVEITAVGGGASGFSVYQPSNYYGGPGGRPGNVRRRRVAIADMPDTASIVVGAGGANTGSGQSSLFSNGGGATTMAGVVRAAGGAGYTQGASNSNPDLYLASMAGASDAPSGAPGRSGYDGNSFVAPKAAQPSFGPGAGGGGAGSASSTSTAYNGGAGGDGTYDDPVNVRAGGAGGTTGGAGGTTGGAVGQPGASSASNSTGITADGRSIFGGGGGGGSSAGAGGSPVTDSLAGGAGGFPGGGGGGGGKATSSGGNFYAGAGGAGGNGCLDVVAIQETT